MTRYAAIVLAGGFSERMGRLKPVLPLGKETIADHVITTFLSAGIDVFLVVGHRRDEVKTGIKTLGVTMVDNPDYANGMFSSIQSGLRHLPPGYQAFFILPVDIPLVRAATIKRLAEVAEKQPENIIYPVFKDKRGHPPLISTSIVPDILGWKKEGGLKAALTAAGALTLEIPVPDANILFDVDTPEDYGELLKRFRRYELPTDEECEVILDDICEVAPERIRHCNKVAAIAVALGQALNASGQSIDPEISRAAALLHDIAKGQPKHDIAGGKILRELGFAKVGDIVAAHTDLAGGDINLPLEIKIVFLADKFALGEKLVSLEERYSAANRPFALTPETQAAIAGRFKVAKSVKQEFERLLGYPLENILKS